MEVVDDFLGLVEMGKTMTSLQRRLIGLNAGDAMGG